MDSGDGAGGGGVDIQYLDGVRVVVREGLGRVLVATRDFAVGDVVLRESPLVVYDAHADLVDQVLAMDDAARAAVLDMAHVKYDEQPRLPACRPAEGQLKHDAARLAKSRSRPRGSQRQRGGGAEAVATRDVFNIMSVAHFNAHEMFISSEGYRTTTIPDAKPPGKRCALFPVGSKAVHSCDPNCLHTTKALLGYLSLVAIRPISAGQLVAMRYIKTDQHTQARRAALVPTKDFICECPRCTSGDLLRGLRCDRDNCPFGIVTPTFPAAILDSAPATIIAAEWRCGACGREPAYDALVALLRAEAELSRELNDMERQLHMPWGLRDEGLTGTVSEACSCAGRDLSPTHHLGLRAASACATARASRAQPTVSPSPAARARESRLAVRSGALALRLLECVFAGCPGTRVRCGPGSGSRPHAPTVEGALMALWAFKDLKVAAAAEAGGGGGGDGGGVGSGNGGSGQTVFAAEDAVLVAELQPYVPLLALESGPQDDDVLEMAAALRVPPGPRCSIGGGGGGGGDNASAVLLQCAACHAEAAPGGAGGAAGDGAAALKLCAQCGRVCYCSKECQKRHWRAHHRRVCAQLKELRSEGA